MGSISGRGPKILYDARRSQRIKLNFKILPSSILISLMFIYIYISVQFSCSVMSDSLLPHRLQHTRLPCPSSSQSLLRLMSIKLLMPSNHLILCPLLFLPSIFPSIRVFSSESALHLGWPTYWSFSFSISPSNEEHSGLISFRTDWLDLLLSKGL